MNNSNPEKIFKEIIITGFGGQGIVLAGKILGQAAALGDHMESTLIQSYGPESRGGACSAQVTISDRPISYPYVRSADILAAMSQGGYDKYIEMLKDDGILIVDQDLVKPKNSRREHVAIPCTRMAEEMGRKIVMNIITVGFFSATTGITSYEATRKAVETSVPPGTEEINLRALDLGYNFGKELLEKEKPKAKKTASKKVET